MTVNGYGQCSVFRDQEVIHSDTQLPMYRVNLNNAVLAATYLEGDPCICIAGQGEESGMCLRHAVTLEKVRSIPFKEDVHCVCANECSLGSKKGMLVSATCRVGI